MNIEPLQPTLWRTCRVLANATRLRLFARLVHKQPQSVSQLAEQLALTVPVASQSLRALEARGLLKVKRIRRRVEYRIPAGTEAGARADLISALQAALFREPCPTEQVVKLATAFTHPSRIEIHRSLQSGPKTHGQIQSTIRMSSPALSRHLRKLVTRGFIVRDDEGKYASLRHPHAIGRALSAMTLP